MKSGNKILCVHMLTKFPFILSIQKRSEELAQASGDQVEAAGTLGNKAALGSKGTSAVSHPFSAGSSANVIYMDEFDTCVATLNIVSALYFWMTIYQVFWFVLMVIFFHSCYFID